MFKSARGEHQATGRGDETREHILSVALKLFRKRAYDRATMRDIAKAAKVSLGAAYYYFPSKDALVHAYYERVQALHRAEVEALQGDLEERVRGALVSKLRLIEGDTALLGALFRYAGEASHPLSVFGEAARPERDAAVATFRRALEPAGLAPEALDAAAHALWLAHLGLILRLIHGDSAKTMRLAEAVAALFCAAVRLAATPEAAPFLAPVLALIHEVKS